MSTPESLMEDVGFLLKKFSFLDGADLRLLCRGLDLPVTNLGGSDMAEQLRDKIVEALDSYGKKPSRETERVLRSFRYHFLLKTKFLDRFLDKVKRNNVDQ
ncbi:MAG: hypothetical protein K6T29_09530 [Peptococcaceae bacterium]|nr:hypothetical protein [Peptococcaceae bacterium]